MVVEHWQRCSERLKEELPPQQFGTWIRPLRAELEQTSLHLYAPNRFILDWVKNKYLARISDLLEEQAGEPLKVHLQVSNPHATVAAAPEPAAVRVSRPPAEDARGSRPEPGLSAGVQRK
ncbi:MAG: DnaA N-terminal domain-containing protein, partial [Pseudomonadota bacterium]|nr:DnaA N-terminal domain-containing protein [Pseudomonadota bacterium]